VSNRTEKRAPKATAGRAGQNTADMRLHHASGAMINTEPKPGEQSPADGTR